ncbi:hypothetical protein F4780DRAFT_32010 [Xylariomycetidae sp. FL0641]|nr:hypothetical protein F4780DRAFT_32010 [Xylariomycetidae sp. FL0641]
MACLHCFGASLISGRGFGRFATIDTTLFCLAALLSATQTRKNGGIHIYTRDTHDAVSTLPTYSPVIQFVSVPEAADLPTKSEGWTVGTRGFRPPPIANDG